MKIKNEEKQLVERTRQILWKAFRKGWTLRSRCGKFRIERTEGVNTPKGLSGSYLLREYFSTGAFARTETTVFPRKQFWEVIRKNGGVFNWEPYLRKLLTNTEDMARYEATMEAEEFFHGEFGREILRNDKQYFPYSLGNASGKVKGPSITGTWVLGENTLRWEVNGKTKEYGILSKDETPEGMLTLAEAYGYSQSRIVKKLRSLGILEALKEHFENQYYENIEYCFLAEQFDEDLWNIFTERSKDPNGYDSCKWEVQGSNLDWRRSSGSRRVDFEDVAHIKRSLFFTEGSISIWEEQNDPEEISTWEDENSRTLFIRFGHHDAVTMYQLIPGARIENELKEDFFEDPQEILEECTSYNTAERLKESWPETTMGILARIQRFRDPRNGWLAVHYEQLEDLLDTSKVNADERLLRLKQIAWDIFEDEILDKVWEDD